MMAEIRKKCKPIDYDAVRRKLSEKQQKGEEGLSRVEGLKDLLKAKKEQNLLMQHKKLFHDEFLYSNCLKRSLEDEIDAFIVKTGDNACSDIKEYKIHLEQDINSFREYILDLILSCKNALREFSSGCNSSNAGERINSCVSQINKTLESIVIERIRLEAELSINGLIDGLEDNDIIIETGIPEEAFNLECPDIDLKSSVLEQFILVDSEFYQKLCECEQRLKETSPKDRNRWSGKDHDVFVLIRDSYNRTKSAKARLLYIDLVMKLLPHKSRQEIVEHESWFEDCTALVRGREKLLSAWSRQRAELFNWVENSFEELCTARLLRASRKEEMEVRRKKSEEICGKIQKWRKQKAEMLEFQLQEMKQKLRQLEEKQVNEETMKRTKDKEKIKQYHESLERLKSTRDMEARKRQTILEAELEQQALHNMERVEFRKNQYLEKNKKKKEDTERKEEMEKEKEQILEAIRAKVRPSVERDLMRLWEDTHSWKEKQRIQAFKQTNDMTLKTYTSEQIISDPRFRFEQRLREAGLIDAPIARDIISKVLPHRQPRKDMLSTFKFAND